MPEVKKLTKEEKKQKALEERMEAKKALGNRAAEEMAAYLEEVEKEDTRNPFGDKDAYQKIYEEIMKPNAKRFKSILDYKNDEDLVSNFKENRLMIRKAVQMCDYLNSLSRSERVKQGITTSLIGKLRDWKNEYENLGMFLDCKMMVIQNKNYYNAEKSLEKKKLSIADLKKNRGRLTDREDQIYNEALINLEYLKGLGIKHYPQAIEKHFKGNTIKSKSGDVTRKWSLFGLNWNKPADETFDINHTVKDLDKRLDKRNMPSQKKYDMELGYSWYKSGSVHILNGSAELKKWNDKLQASASADLGKVTFKGGVKCSLVPKKDLVPTLTFDASLTAVGLTGQLKGRVGSDDLNIGGELKVEGGYASGSASIGFGRISYYDSDNDRMVSGHGVKAEAGAEVAAFKGTVKGSFSLFGIKIGLGLSGSALSFGAKAHVTTVNSHVDASLGASLLFGVALNVSIDWSGLKNKFTSWYSRSSRRKKMRSDEMKNARIRRTNLNQMKELVEEAKQKKKREGPGGMRQSIGKKQGLEAARNPGL